MARPRSFDEARALDAAMRVFWAKGYEAASTQDLCAATGLGRSSIYNTFTSKHALFLRALAHYLDTMTAVQSEILGDTARPVPDRLRSLLGSIIETEEANRRDGAAIGCFGVNTSTELGGRDPEATALLARDTEVRLAAFRDTLAAGRHAGEIAPRRDPAAQARYLHAVIAGIRVSAQGGADRAALQTIADTALDALTV